MGRLVMSFRGICIHLHHERVSLPAGVKHRVVAVNAEHGATTINFGDIVPHFSFLEVEQTAATALRGSDIQFDESLDFLNGVNISVLNSIGNPTTQFIHAVPKLTHYRKDTQLRPEILTDTDVPTFDDCYIDMRHGTVIEGRFSAGGNYTTWIVETDGEPVLRFAWSDGEAQPVVLTATVPSTPDEATLSDHVPGSFVVTNSTIDAADKDNDFLLHYLARVGGIPELFDWPFPGEGPATGMSRDGWFIGMTTSCSNSQYP
jgi:hypothetical protein